MRYQVPQFVDIKDRVIGPLTLKQFFYYMVVGMMLVPVYFLANVGVFVTIAIPMLGVAALFAHVRWRGQSFASLLWYGSQYLTGERMYIWRRVAGAGDINISGSEYEEFSDIEFSTASALDTIVQTLNAHGNVIEQDATDPLLEEAATS